MNKSEKEKIAEDERKVLKTLYYLTKNVLDPEVYVSVSHIEKTLIEEQAYGGNLNLSKPIRVLLYPFCPNHGMGLVLNAVIEEKERDVPIIRGYKVNRKRLKEIEKYLNL